MPIYEYRCEQGHTFEVMQRMSDDPVVSCQTCSAPVERVFHPVAVHFKGSGFYNTDYGTRKRAREQKESSDGASKESSDSASKESSERSSKDSGEGKKSSGSDSAKSGSGSESKTTASSSSSSAAD